VIGEDEALLRQGLTLVLEQCGHEVAAAAANAEDLRAETRRHEPDLVVTDIRMPPSFKDEGLLAALELRRAMPSLAVLVLSQHVQRRHAVELMEERSTGLGYLLKQRIADIDTFCRDIERIGAGETVLDPEVVAAMISRARRTDEAVHRLTPRQHDVLGLMAEGLNNAAIAKRLSIAERSVVQHASHIYDELGLAPDDEGHRRVLAVLQYLAR
jgi:DNA-binding NarL/FixJ family response regulator